MVYLFTDGYLLVQLYQYNLLKGHSNLPDSEYHFYTSVQFSRSVVSLCDAMNRSMPGFPVYHQLPESTETHVHRVGNDIQPSHPLSLPYPPALNLSQHQGLFK